MANAPEDYLPDSSQLNRCRWTSTAPTRLALSVTTAKTAALTPGKLYKVTADVDYHINQGPQGTVTATTNDYFVSKGWPNFVWVTAANVDDGVAAILDASTGNLYIKEMQ